MTKKAKTAAPTRRRPGELPAYEGDFTPPATHTERAKTLVGLPMPALLPFLQDAARNDKLDWLNTAMDIGTFSISREMARDGEAKHSVHAAMAVMEFLKGSDFLNCNEDPAMGLAAEDFNLQHVAVSDGFKAFFAEFARHLVAENRACMQQKFDSMSPEESKDLSRDGWRLDHEANILMAQVLVGAFALNDVELVREIVTHSPYVLNACLPSDLLGSIDPLAAGEDLLQGTVDICPAYHAVQFGRGACLAAARAASPEEPPFGMRTVEVPAAPGMPRHMTSNTMDWVDCLVELNARSAVPTGFPSEIGSEMQRALALPDAKDTHRESLHALAMQGMPSAGYRMFPLFNGFEVTDIHAFNPTETVRTAIGCGSASHVGVTGDVDWSRVFTADLEVNPFMKGMLGATKATIAPYEAAMVAAIQRASDEGFGHLAVAQHPMEKRPNADYAALAPVMSMPLDHFLVENFNQVLVTLLKNGLDPVNPTVPGGESPLAAADKVSPAMAHTLRTFTTRRRAMAALDALEEIDAGDKADKGVAP